MVIKNDPKSRVMTTDLELQRAYTDRLKNSGEKSFTLIATEAFFEGIRDSGYKSTATAVDEFIDNSIQAQANRIDVVYDTGNARRQSRDISNVAIIDNGHGMEPDMMRASVTWGGTHRHNDRSGFGRYGFGLPSAAINITRQYGVYSRVKGGEWYSVPINLNPSTK